MEEVIDMGMTDKQFERVLLMVRGIAEKCTTAKEVVEFIDGVLDGKVQKEKTEDKTND